MWMNENGSYHPGWFPRKCSILEDIAVTKTKMAFHYRSHLSEVICYSNLNLFRCKCCRKSSAAGFVQFKRELMSQNLFFRIRCKLQFWMFNKYHYSAIHNEGECGCAWVDRSHFHTHTPTPFWHLYHTPTHSQPQPSLADIMNYEGNGNQQHGLQFNYPNTPYNYPNQYGQWYWSRCIFKRIKTFCSIASFLPVSFLLKPARFMIMI
jgi:hypothetical protein